MKIISGIAHNHDESKVGLMVNIEFNLKLSFDFQEKPRPVMILWLYSRPVLI